jgi:autonomous glycyl radical cofactor GrcA
MVGSDSARTANGGSGRNRRWLIGLDPIFEGGRKGARARNWDVEDELVAITILGDVTIDLSAVRSAPPEVRINAWALWRDVDIEVSPETRVELSGGKVLGDLTNEASAAPGKDSSLVVRVHGHSLLGDVTVRVAGT